MFPQNPRNRLKRSSGQGVRTDRRTEKCFDRVYVQTDEQKDVLTECTCRQMNRKIFDLTSKMMYWIRDGIESGILQRYVPQLDSILGSAGEAVV